MTRWKKTNSESLVYFSGRHIDENNQMGSAALKNESGIQTGVDNKYIVFKKEKNETTNVRTETPLVHQMNAKQECESFCSGVGASMFAMEFGYQ